ncbi:MFS transporter [Bacillus canaveralius]|uniref:MFS transporter n=1 Tax=Bacillus canaveralius TaxID=1403243 RepID=UPI001FE4C661|nr:MFS transporter [Bacillus canaveralius]
MAIVFPLINRNRNIYIRDFIYLIAINLLVFEMTHSAAAVAGLWIVGPVTSMLTNSWSGSIIDRANKKKIMIIADVARAVGVAIIPFVSNIWTIYVLLFLISVARAFFAPSSTTYIAKLIPVNKRKKFNSINSLVNSGAFIVGPSIAGALFLIGSVKIAILLNAVSFLISAFIIMFLPDTDQQANPAEVKKGSYETLRDDWKEVIQFGREKSFVLAVYACFLAFGLFSLTLRKDNTCL